MFFKQIFYFFDGFLSTLKTFFQKKVTINYPKEKIIKNPNFRGKHILQINMDGTGRCIACRLCEVICPVGAIVIESKENDDGIRIPVRYDIDLSKCIYCGFCKQACPVNAITQGDDLEFSTCNKQDLYVTKEAIEKRV